MITEDPLEQLAIQWFQDTGGENIDHRTLNIERRSEEMRSLVEVPPRVATPGRVSHEVTKSEHTMCRPLRAWNTMDDGTQGVAVGNRIMPRWGVRRITP